jgi:hypothetical protein
VKEEKKYYAGIYMSREISTRAKEMFWLFDDRNV